MTYAAMWVTRGASRRATFTTATAVAAVAAVAAAKAVSPAAMPRDAAAGLAPRRLAAAGAPGCAAPGAARGIDEYVHRSCVGSVP